MMEEESEEKLFSGFSLRDQELKYNLTLFDLVMTLSARVVASLKLSKPTRSRVMCDDVVGRDPEGIQSKLE